MSSECLPKEAQGPLTCFLISSCLQRAGRESRCQPIISHQEYCDSLTTALQSQASLPPPIICSSAKMIFICFKSSLALFYLALCRKSLDSQAKLLRSHRTWSLAYLLPHVISSAPKIFATAIPICLPITHHFLLIGFWGYAQVS